MNFLNTQVDKYFFIYDRCSFVKQNGTYQLQRVKVCNKMNIVSDNVFPMAINTLTVSMYIR